MNTIIQGRLDRVETALNHLTDSITSYNPSVAAAVDLLHADDELDSSVKQLATHQANHARILRLKETTNGLNQQITSTLILLADSRKELLSTPASPFPGNQRNVPYPELLDYAKRISRFTVPPTFRSPPPAAAPVSRPLSLETVNGVPSTTAQTNTATLADGDKKGLGIGVSSLGPNEVEWLDPLNQIPFVPWPSEEVIKRGALAQIQIMSEQGIDPISVVVGGDEGTSEKGSEALRSDSVKSENNNGQQDMMAVLVSRPMQTTERSVKKPRVFGGLELYNPEEED